MTRHLVAIALLFALAACAKSGSQIQATPSPLRIPSGPSAGEPPGYQGMGAGQLRAAFGTPVFQRKDGVTQMWRYDGAACKAFFFLYGDAGREQVRHVETLPQGTRAGADPICLNALKKPVS